MNNELEKDPMNTWPTIPVPRFDVAEGPFDPNWESLRADYNCPEWFQDAKLGFWTHWGPQSHGTGDWMDRNMYVEGHPSYDLHLKQFGHPSVHGVKDNLCNWKAEKFDPEKLIKMFKDAGAQYFCHMVNHHDNFDSWDSKWQPWNSVNIGPKKDITGLWEKACRAAGLPFGVTFHNTPDRIWNTFMPKWYGTDKDGPYKGVPYDGAVVTKEDGIGTEWEGLDPRDLYGPIHEENDPCPTMNRQFMWRVDDVIRKYSPDLLYFDTAVVHLVDESEKLDLRALLGMPDLTPQLAAHYYNVYAEQHDGKADCVFNIKHIVEDPTRKEFLSSSVVPDFENVEPNAPLPFPWQTDTSIGGWHHYPGMKYRETKQVIDTLLHVVSNNGCMLLGCPLPLNGEPDEGQLNFFREFTPWIQVNGEAIFATRPWVRNAEYVDEAAHEAFVIDLTDNVDRKYLGSRRDIINADRLNRLCNFNTSKDQKILYATILQLPNGNDVTIQSLSTTSTYTRKVTNVRLLGHEGALSFVQDEKGLHVTLPEEKPCDYAWSLVIS